MRLNLLHLVAAHAKKAAMLALGAARADVITL